MSFKTQIQLVAAVLAAGFKLVDHKRINTDDGYCWHATLSFGSQKLITVSNGGFGGPDEIAHHISPKSTKQSIDQALAVFAAIPEVRSIVTNFRIDVAKYSHPDPTEFEAKKTEILASTTEFTEDDLGIVIDEFAAATADIKKYKAKLKTHILFAKAGADGDDDIYHVKAADTPRTREILQSRHQILYFVADELATLP